VRPEAGLLPEAGFLLVTWTPPFSLAEMPRAYPAVLDRSFLVQMCSRVVLESSYLVIGETGVLFPVSAGYSPDKSYLSRTVRECRFVRLRGSRENWPVLVLTRYEL
jgi:capsular polysaccharide biosynthesis protein